MIRYDCHIHTAFSSDSVTNARDQIEKAIELGMEGICITDHMDYDFPEKERSGCDFEFDPEAYFTELDALKEEYSGRIRILTGVETGLRNEPGCTEQMRMRYAQLAASYPFDYIIGSVHCLENTDPYYESPYWDDKDKGKGIMTYFEATRYNVASYSDFDSLGHLDYLVRYVPLSKDPLRKGKTSDYDVRDYKDIIDEILKILINKGLALEVNTAGLKYGLGYAHPKEEILKRYLELNGELLTIGSDGHKPEHICYGFDETCEMLRRIGIKYYTVFEKRRPVMMKL